jgi:hypothetical protein
MQQKGCIENVFQIGSQGHRTLLLLDFFLWGHVKNLVYRVPVNNLDTLRNRIRDAMAMVTTEMLQNVRRNLLKRVRLCIQAGGGRFEHLL